MDGPKEIPGRDNELLEQFGQGSLASLGQLYRRYCRPLYLYVHSLTRDAFRSEDIVQQTFVRILERDPRTIQSVKGLLYAIARNLVRDDVRRSVTSEKSYPRLAAASGTVPPGPEETERLEILSQGLNELPEDQREVVILRIHADLPFVEIARTLEIPEATAKSRYRYALEKLGERLEPHGGTT